MDPKDHFMQIYRLHGTTYHELISYEDTDGNLRPSLTKITSFASKSILDLGTGTGRIPLLFPDSNITGVDLHWEMLIENQRQQRPDPRPLVQGDMRILPFSNNCFEIVTAGWALGHFTGWFGDQWQQHMEQVLNEVSRVLKPEGWLVILETMTTGSHTPAPPSEGLATYYRWLEEDLGFETHVIQTDYLFDDLSQATRYAQFFFGIDLAKKVRKHNWVRLPEWTGIWARQIG
ncbi:MAG: class I SAM-dependent methyltransferase [Anaerolineales bacterium]|nr:class I SAM-dependent methyltransferase [Anaerolineales bacterium]